jgi:Rod binding domain-containing protein
MADPSILGAQALLANKPVEAPGAVSGKTKAQLQEAAKQFESVFISQMFGLMNEDLPTEGPFFGGQGESMIRSMMNDQYAKSISARGGVGLSDTVYRELLAYQEGSSHAAAGPSKAGQ